MKPHNPTAVIYGLFVLSGRCIYVGATVQPKTREAHLRLPRFGPKGLSDYHWTFKQLVTCSLATAGQIELAKIKHYKALGQAELNQNMVGHPARSKGNGVSVRCKENGLTFVSYSEAARHFGCALTVITKAINKHGGKMRFFVGKPLTLELVRWAKPGARKSISANHGGE